MFKGRSITSTFRLWQLHSSYELFVRLGVRFVKPLGSSHGVGIETRKERAGPPGLALSIPRRTAPPRVRRGLTLVTTRTSPRLYYEPQTATSWLTSNARALSEVSLAYVKRSQTASRALRSQLAWSSPHLDSGLLAFASPPPFLAVSRLDVFGP